MAVRGFQAPAPGNVIMTERLFGTDGIRGLANVAPMNAETALRLGRAVAQVAGPKNTAGKKKILLGKDTRISGYLLEYALTAGICSMGANVLLVGPMPTPGIAFLTQNMRCNAGVVISASHNPFEDNGIKFFSHDGFKLSNEHERRIEKIVEDNSLDADNPRGIEVGRVHRIDDALGRYIVFLKSTFPKNISLEGIKIVLDCANGAAYRVAPTVFEELGATVIPIGVAPNGSNINKDCGSLYPEKMCELVRQNGAHIGVALDGDADRVIFADEHGAVVDGDQIMGLIAFDLIDKGLLAKNTLVATVMSNMGLEVALRSKGIKLVRTDVGDRYVVDRMKADGYTFGGEQSGHLIFLDYTASGDGILTALQTLRVMTESGKRLSELAAPIERYPQLLKNVDVNNKPPLDDIPSIKAAIRDAELKLGDQGRLLVRHSGTQMMCRVMAEGPNEKKVMEVVENVADAISRHLQ